MILLCSDGLSSQELLAQAAALVPSGGRAALVVTADPEYREENWNVPRCKAEMEYLGLKVDCFDFDRQPASELDNYDVVELMGGSPYHLLSSIRRSIGGEEALRALSRRGLLIGWSAGAAVLGPSLHLADRYLSEKNTEGLSDLRGLGFVPFHILPHRGKFLRSDPAYVSRGKAFARESGKSVFPLDDGEGLLADEEGKLVREIRLRQAVCVAGVDFKNPLIAASGTFGFGREYAELYPLSVWGGVSCKGTTLRPRPGNPPPRVAETPAGMLNAVGLQNPGVERFLGEELPWLSRQGTRVIANIAGSSPEDYAQAADRLNDSPVDMVELNISCPNVKEGGVQFGTSVQGVYGVTSLVKKACSKPLMVKLSPNVTDISEMALAAESAGADAISLINTLTGMRVDIRSRRPILHNNTGGLSGPAVLPVALRMVWQCWQKVKIPIVGLGGISCWQDAVEMLLAGAAAIQVGTALFADPYAPLRIREGLERYMEENGVSSLSQLTGGLRPW